jgi:ABC-type microcin C transport system permease subunit YejB
VRSRLLGKIHFDLTYRFLMTKTLHRQQFFFTAKIDMNSTTVSSLENPYFRNLGRLKTDSNQLFGPVVHFVKLHFGRKFFGKNFVIQIFPEKLCMYICIYFYVEAYLIKQNMDFFRG